MSDFARINAPRVAKVLATLEHIETSAKSNRATPEEAAALLAPIFPRLAELAPVVIQHADAPTAPPQEPTQIEATPPVAREAEALADLTTQQLVDRMIACGAILAKRRK